MRKEAYAHFVEELGEQLHDVEHYRVVVEGVHEGATEHPINVAIAVLTDGRAFVGTARCSWLDAYSRRLGHTMAVGRALKRAVEGVRGQRDEDGRANAPLKEGVALRDECRAQALAKAAGKEGKFIARYYDDAEGYIKCLFVKDSGPPAARAQDGGSTKP